jgi:hypothetical protein
VRSTLEQVFLRAVGEHDAAQGRAAAAPAAEPARPEEARR